MRNWGSTTTTQELPPTILAPRRRWLKEHMKFPSERIEGLMWFRLKPRRESSSSAITRSWPRPREAKMHSRHCLAAGSYAATQYWFRRIRPNVLQPRAGLRDDRKGPLSVPCATLKWKMVTRGVVGILPHRPVNGKTVTTQQQL